MGERNPRLTVERYFRIRCAEAPFFRSEETAGKQEDERREDAEWRRMTLRGIMRELRLAGGGRLSSFGR